MDADAVKEFRVRLKLNKAQLAKKLGVSKGLVWGWESGRTRISALDQRRLIRLAGEQIP
jgi:DNA-binding transcriptional regulator YiaG